MSFSTLGWWMHVSWEILWKLEYCTHKSSWLELASQLPTNICLFVFKKRWNRKRTQKSSVLPPAGGWRLILADGRWCWNLRCHAPATFPSLTPRSVSTSGTRSDHRSSPSNSVSSPLWTLCGRHLLPDLYGKSSLSESQEKKKMLCYINL